MPLIELLMAAGIFVVLLLVFGGAIDRIVSGSVGMISGAFKGFTTRNFGFAFVGTFCTVVVVLFVFAVLIPVYKYLDRSFLIDHGIGIGVSLTRTLMAMSFVAAVLSLGLYAAVTWRFYPARRTVIFGALCAVVMAASIASAWNQLIGGPLILATTRSFLSELILLSNGEAVAFAESLPDNPSQVEVGSYLTRIGREMYEVSDAQLGGSDSVLSFTGELKRIEPSSFLVRGTQNIEILGYGPSSFTSMLLDSLSDLMSLRAGTADLVPLSTDSPRAYRALASGVSEMLSHTRIGLETAMGRFDAAIADDSSYGLAYAYRAYAMCLYANRGWVDLGSETNSHLPNMTFADTVSGYLDYAREMTSDGGASPSNPALEFMVLRTQGLLYQVYGMSVLNHCEKKGRDPGILRDLALDFAIGSLNRSRMAYIEAILRRPLDHRSKNNLALVYLALARAQRVRGDGREVLKSLALAQQAIENTLELNFVDERYRMNKALILYDRFRWVDTSDSQLYSNARALLLEGASSFRDPSSRALSLYNLACISSDRRETDDAKAFLCRALEIGGVEYNFRKIALEDADLSWLRNALGQDRFVTLLDSCSAQPSQVPLSPVTVTSSQY